MKITKRQLQEIIKEELANVLNEGYGPEWNIEQVGLTLNRWLRGGPTMDIPRGADPDAVLAALHALGAEPGGSGGPVWHGEKVWTQEAHDAVAAIVAPGAGLLNFMEKAKLGAGDYEWEGKPLYNPTRSTDPYYAKKEKEQGVDHTAGGAGNFPAYNPTRTDWTKRGRG